MSPNLRPRPDRASEKQFHASKLGGRGFAALSPKAKGRFRPLATRGRLSESQCGAGLSGATVKADDWSVSVADDELAEVASELDAWDREDPSSWAFDDRLPECAREGLALLEAVRPIIPIVLKLGAGQEPGADATEDASWAASIALARRTVLAQLAAGIDHALGSDSLRLLNRLDAMVGEWSEDWEDVSRRRVRELVDAGRRGRQRGQELREQRHDIEPHSHFNIGWLLRHPTDHYLRLATATVADSEMRVLIENQIARLAPSYQELCDLNWTTEEAVADVICEMQVLATSPGSWTKPMSALVTMPIKGNTSIGEQITVRLVERLGGPFNGTLVSFLAGERWLTCARELEDGTLLPLDGTRRSAAPSV
jgi:hypothetical protein